jgi:hypothetical protein
MILVLRVISLCQERLLHPLARAAIPWVVHSTGVSNSVSFNLGPFPPGTSGAKWAGGWGPATHTAAGRGRCRPAAPDVPAPRTQKRRETGGAEKKQIPDCAKPDGGRNNARKKGLCWTSADTLLSPQSLPFVRRPACFPLGVQVLAFPLSVPVPGGPNRKEEAAAPISMAAAPPPPAKETSEQVASIGVSFD